MAMTDELPVPPPTRSLSRATLTLRCGVLVAALLGAAWLLTSTMLRFAPEQPRLLGVSAVFFVTTGVLALASFALQNAVWAVRREKQVPLRAWLVVALGAGVLFMGLQAYAMADFGPSLRAASQGESNASGFVAGIVATHAGHVVIAVFVLSMVTLKAFADRYDHEYYWGVSFCAGFWHFLGLIWLSVLGLSCVAV